MDTALAASPGVIDSSWLVLWPIAVSERLCCVGLFLIKEDILGRLSNGLLTHDLLATTPIPTPSL